MSNGITPVSLGQSAKLELEKYRNTILLILKLVVEIRIWFKSEILVEIETFEFETFSI